MDCTLKPKGTESDYNGWVYIIGNGHTVPGLEMAPKAFIIYLYCRTWKALYTPN